MRGKEGRPAYFVIPAKPGIPPIFDRRIAPSGTPACAGVTCARLLGLHHGGPVSRNALHRRDERPCGTRLGSPGRGSKFCSRYGLRRLVYGEQGPTIEEAVAREKAIKKWN